MFYLQKKNYGILKNKSSIFFIFLSLLSYLIAALVCNPTQVAR